MNKKNIIIIGATSGIGRALFEKYADEGCRLGMNKNLPFSLYKRI